MIILTIRTDKPEAEIGLYDGHSRLAYESWTAHRELGLTIHQKISDILQAADKKLSDIQAIVAFKGPGSFTGLRIGLTVANTLAYSLKVPIVGTSSTDDVWISNGIVQLLAGESETVVLPEYGAEAHITTPRK